MPVGQYTILAAYSSSIAENGRESMYRPIMINAITASASNTFGREVSFSSGSRYLVTRRADERFCIGFDVLEVIGSWPKA